MLALNAGSSTLKFAAYRIDGAAKLSLLVRGVIEGDDLQAWTSDGDQAQSVVRPLRDDASRPLSTIRELLHEHAPGLQLLAVGHRVVHGGTDFGTPVRVTTEVLTALDALTPLAPLHQPPSLSLIRALLVSEPDLPQAVSFDTAFHRTMPTEAQRFALPSALHESGVRRYGFHGLSYEFIAQHLRETSPDLASGRVVVAHLGAGSSLCAMRGGRSVDTTMSFTPVDGLPMATRSGSIDPGAVLYLIEERGMSPAEVRHLLLHESGLLGISGVSGDMRTLLESDAPSAREAIDYFVYRVAREIGAMAAVLGGIDALVFTGGIGEHAQSVREAICERASWLGVRLDRERNHASAELISRTTSAVQILVIPTNEELVVARGTLAVLRGA